jgi:hypothetical protein
MQPETALLLYNVSMAFVHQGPDGLKVESLIQPEQRLPKHFWGIASLNKFKRAKRGYFYLSNICVVQGCVDLVEDEEGCRHVGMDGKK